MQGRFEADFPSCRTSSTKDCNNMTKHVWVLSSIAHTWCLHNNRVIFGIDVVYIFLNISLLCYRKYPESDGSQDRPRPWIECGRRRCALDPSYIRFLVSTNTRFRSGDLFVARFDSNQKNISTRSRLADGPAGCR